MIHILQHRQIKRGDEGNNLSAQSCHNLTEIKRHFRDVWKHLFPVMG